MLRSQVASSPCLGASVQQHATNLVVRPQPSAPHAQLAAAPCTSGQAGSLPIPGFAPCAAGFSRRAGVVAHGHISAQVTLPMNLDLETPLPGFDSIESALKDLEQGKFVVVLDDEHRENEGDLIMNADKVTTEAMAFMVEHTSGVICISMEGKDMERLKLPLMVSSAENEDSMYTAFTVTVDLKEGISTGISAGDRAKTIRKMADPTSTPQEFRRPGHIFPLRYRAGGVLLRPGHTEAAVDLARLSGSHPSGVLCEIVSRKDGSMARTPELLQFSKQYGLKCITIADLIRYRLRHESVINHVATAQMQSAHGPVTVHSFKSTVDETEHAVFVVGDVQGKSDVPVYVHQERTVADLLGAAEPSTSTSFSDALQQVCNAGAGVVVYLRGQTSRALHISDELKTPATSPLYATDLREIGAASQMLRHLNIKSASILGGNADVLHGLQSCGLKVAPAPHVNGNGAVNGHHMQHAALSGRR